MSLLKKLAGLAVGAAALGAVAYVLQNREHHDDEYEHIWGPEDEVEPAAKTPDFDAPNVNPVELGHVEASRTPDGKIDPTQIVDPAVAGDWEEQGCKG